VGWRRLCGKSRGGGRGWKVAGASMIASGIGRVEETIGRKAVSGSGAGDRKVEVECAAVQGIGAERDDSIKITQHGKSENSVDSDVGAESKRNGDAGAGAVEVGSVVADDGC
jgi:hypothetical protein